MSYTAAANPIKDADGDVAADFTDQAVVNNTADTTAPGLKSATVAGATLTLYFDESLAAAANLSNDAFGVKRTPRDGGEGDGEPERDAVHRRVDGDADAGRGGGRHRHGREGELCEADDGQRQRA